MAFVEMLLLRASRRVCTASRLRIASRYASSDFGRRNGGAIANKASILSDVDDALTGGRPPDLEVLLADHLTAIDSPAAEWAHTLFLRYGHVSVRYTTSDGRQRVMNILGGVEGADMVNMVEPSDYSVRNARPGDVCAKAGRRLQPRFRGRPSGAVRAGRHRRFARVLRGP